MSNTLSIDMVGAKYWSYMATVMTDCLREISQTRTIHTGDVPRGVYRDAKKFFNLVMQSVGNDLPDNPPASLNAYSIAAYAVKDSSEVQPSNLEELGERLEAYAKLLNRLETPGNLDEHEVATAEDLRLFFRELAQAGEAQVYERAVDLEPALASYR